MKLYSVKFMPLQMKSAYAFNSSDNDIPTVGDMLLRASQNFL